MFIDEGWGKRKKSTLKAGRGALPSGSGGPVVRARLAREFGVRARRKSPSAGPRLTRMGQRGR